MYTFRLSILAILFCCVFQTISAQQVYQSRHYGGPGTIYLYNSLTGILPDQEIKESGDSVTWDLTAFAELNTHATEIVAPSEAIDQFTFITICALSGISPVTCFNIWSSTDQALLLQDSLALLGLSLQELQRYQNKTPNLLLENFFGFTVDFGGSPTSAVIVYQKPDTVLQFPVTYQDSFTSHVSWMLDLSATGMNIQYESQQIRTTEVDAWGTVMTPYDTFTNVVRVRAEIQHTDTLYSDSLALPVNLTQVEYMWFDTSYKLPVLIATGLKTDSLEIINVIQYIYEATCPAPTWTASTGETVYYLDASGSVTVDFNISGSNADVYSWDFGDGTFEDSDSSTTHTYTLAGSYAVAVIGCMSDCLPLNSCSFAILDFEIIDTITSINVIPGNEVGIQLYPNPVTDMLWIDIPERLGNLQYRMVDVTGKLSGEGSIVSGKSEIPVPNLINGIYSLQLWKAETPDQLLIMRFGILRN